jgi:hypothetical protein
MKHGWIGVVAGLAVGTAVVLVTQRGSDDGAPHRPTLAEGRAALAACDPGDSGLAAAYDRVAAPVHTYLTSEPAKALDAAHGQVANLLDHRIGVCVHVLEVQHALGSAFTDPRLPQIAPFVQRLHAARNRLTELVAALQSPQAGDAPQKLEALDAALH